MAKKKNYPVALSEYTPPPVSDNNPSSGLVDLPNGALYGCYYPKDKFNFVGIVAGGESPNKPDVYIQNANGTVSSMGEGNNQEYNYWKGDSGVWNKNRGWPGGNRTGE